MNLLKKLFDHEYKELERFKKIADQIMEEEPVIEKLTDEELKGKTKEFQDRLKNGETLEDIKVEAFAVAREAAYRVIGEKPYYVQILGGLAIHYGNIAEMKTGKERLPIINWCRNWLKSLRKNAEPSVAANCWACQRKNLL